jgi:uncharacterized coiled-coil protein SlyX
VTKAETAEYRALASRVRALEAKLGGLERLVVRLTKDLELAESFIDEQRKLIRRLTKELEEREP